jgi:branched-chain amino acid transport system permease protein
VTFDLIVQYLFAALTVGSIYATVAVGFNVIYNATGIINFAQGEFVMIGAMTAHSLSRVLPLAPAIAAAVVLTAAVGAALELLLIRRLRNPSVLRMIIVTIGASIVIRELALHVWDEKVRALPFFTGSEVTSVRILGAHVSPQVFWVLGVSGLAVAALQLFFRFSLTGRAMRACSVNPRAARLSGIPAGRMVTLSFALSAALGALGGCLLSPLTQTHYAIGTPLAIKGFTAAVLGGLGDSVAAVAAGLILAALETFSVSILPAAYQDVVAMVILLAMLVFRPSGLFGSRAASALRDY